MREKDNKILELEEKIRKIELNLRINQIDGVDDDWEASDDTSADKTANEELDTFMESEKANSYRCDYCDFSSKTSQGVKIHIGKKHKLLCDECSAHFHDEEHMRMHNQCFKRYIHVKM